MIDLAVSTQKLRDKIRTLFGIRKKRQKPPVNRHPHVRDVLLRGNVKMLMTTEITPEFWEWLLLCGWRINHFRNDRRLYASMPSDALRRLIAAHPSERDSIHKQLLSSAKMRVGR